MYSFLIQPVRVKDFRSSPVQQTKLTPTLEGPFNVMGVPSVQMKCVCVSQQSQLQHGASTEVNSSSGFLFVSFQLPRTSYNLCHSSRVSPSVHSFAVTRAKHTHTTRRNYGCSCHNTCFPASPLTARHKGKTAVIQLLAAATAMHYVCNTCGEIVGPPNPLSWCWCTNPTCYIDIKWLFI